jgi:hypothetical protein
LVASVRISKLAANLVTVPIGLAFMALCLWAVFSLPGAVRVSPHDSWIFLALVFPLILAHETLHGLAAVWWGGVAWRELRYGVYWKLITPYCHCPAPLTVRVYRRMALLPFVVSVVAGPLALLAYPALWVAMLFGTAMAGCAGDLWVYARLRRFAPNLIVVDHPEQIGCDLFESAPSA